MDTDVVALVHPGFPKPKHVRRWVDGGWLRRESRAGTTGRLRQSGKEYGSPREARCALATEQRQRMRGGFVALRDPAEAAFGESILVCAVPTPVASEALDLHPEGHTLVVGTTLKGSGAGIHLIDVRTGIRRLVHTEPSKAGQAFVHSVRFGADGRGVVYALDGETRYLDLRSGTSHTLGAHDELRGSSNFNPFHVRPSWDRARRRLLVFDAGARIRVVDDAWESLLDLDVARRPECRAGALSPSGRLLALAFGTTSSDIEVWDVDSGRQVHHHRFPRPFPYDHSSAGLRVKALGFDPTERHLIANGGFDQGPCSISLETGKFGWAVPDPHRSVSWGTCWDFSPDGSLLAVGGMRRVRLQDAATGAGTPVQPAPTEIGHILRVVFSDAGDLLACAGSGGGIVVLRAIAPE
ncbi:WD40 repeat domain-containing protein [Embleya sp. NPDC001921]